MLYRISYLGDLFVRLPNPRGSFFAGFSKADCESIFAGRYSPNLLAATLAVLAGCGVHYAKAHAGVGNDNTSAPRPHLASGRFRVILEVST